MTRPVLAIVTAGDANGRRLSHVLSRMGIDYRLLVIAHRPPKRPRNRWQVWRAHIAAQPAIRALWQSRRLPFARRAEFGGFCNSARMKAALRRISPDYILMMGGGIIDAEVIGLARHGVLNAHPGLLPWLRGVDVIRHAVDREIPIGVTGHFIDVGIDTGAIIDRVRLTIDPADDHDAIQHHADLVCVGMMAGFARTLWDGGALSGIGQPEQKSPYCKAMSPDDAARIDACIAAGAAAELQRREPWHTQFASDAAPLALYRRAIPPGDKQG